MCAVDPWTAAGRGSDCPKIRRPMWRTMLWILLLFLVRFAQGQGPGVAVSGLTMRSREVDMRIQFEIEEGQPPGTLVGTIPIKPNFTYRFNENPPEFYLNRTTGTITTALEIDRELLRTDRFDLVILSSQPTYPIEVRIVVLDINDNSPVFPESSIQITFSESANVGTRVILDTATDGDAGLNDVTTDYKIVSGNEESKFRLVVTTNPSGETPYLHLETVGPVDREANSHYQLNISAQDGGNPPRMGYLQVNITVLDVNDNPPIFDHSDYSVSLNESVPPGTVVLQVRATDNDQGDNARVAYFLSDGETQFSVDPQTGIISTSEILRCQPSCPAPHDKCPKSCVFTVFARDHGSPRQDGRAYVTVNLVDANDHDPIIRFRFFPSTASHATVDENAQNGSVVAAVSVIDLDEGSNGQTSVEIQGGNELNHFRMESTPSFDIVRVSGVLDREEVSKYNLTITATDKGLPARSSTAFLIIHVNDVNDHEPIFERSDYSAVLGELTPVGSYVAGITATDQDTGINSNIYYAIVSGNDRRWFEVDIQTGLVTTAAPLDREMQDFVELKISARDGGPSPRWTFTFLRIQILDENDDGPAFAQKFFNVSLSESAPSNSLVAVVSAVDNDLGTNGSLIYAWHNDVERRYPDVFHLDATYGRLTTRLSLDREETPSYTLKVVAKDQGPAPRSATVTVHLTVNDVNDNQPVFYPSFYLARVVPDAPPGTEVVLITATDADEGKNAIITYSLSGNYESDFQINSTSGMISTRGTLRQSRYELKVHAVNPGDRDLASKSAVVFVFVTRERTPMQFGRNYSFIIEEDSEKEEPKLGTEVGQVFIERTLTPVKYAILSGDPLSWFQVDPRSGIITTRRAIDRETTSQVVLTLAAYWPSDFTETQVTIKVTDLNDCQPQFQDPPLLVGINENWPVGHEVALFRALDRDEKVNGIVEYSLHDPTGAFSIDRDTGMVSLARTRHLRSGAAYDLQIVARDSGGLAAEQKTTVSVLDVNDHTPIFDHATYETSLPESTPVNERFFAVLATDADLGENGRIFYTMSKQGNEDSKFGVFPDGQLYVKGHLDRETRDYYGLNVVARDNGTEVTRAASVSVIVHVVDENDNPPQFQNKTFTFYLSENEPPDTYVGQLVADDRDKDRNAELTYSISTSQKDFVVDPKTGFLRSLREFDREKLTAVSGHDYIVMEATVLDGGLSRLRDEAKVIVHIADVNDNSPLFVRTPYTATISEGAPSRTQVIRVSATDADDGLNGRVLYTIESGNEEGFFQLDENTGQIILSRVLDRETTPRYVLTILANDAVHTSTATITVDVLDENDNAPRFESYRSEVEIPETAAVGVRIFHFKASDNDVGTNGVVTYTLAAGNIKETFRIDAVSGVLMVARPLDYEEQNVFHLNVSAHDGGSPRLTSAVPLTIRVTDVNDNPPVFPSVAIVRQIEEGIPPNTPVVTVTAEDRDSGQNGKVSYQISQQEPAGKHFDIRPENGVIYTREPIDREFSDSFRLTVIATDHGESVRLSAEKTVTIIVEDINDNAPTFVSMDTGVLPEGAERGHVVATISATDPDANTNGMVTYELVDGPPEFLALDRHSGLLTLTHSVANPSVSYAITVQATDEAVVTQRKSSRSQIVIIGASKSTGKDWPVFSASEYSGSVYENEPAGSSVLTVNAYYPGERTLTSHALEYYLTSITSDGAPEKRLFAINRHNGALSTAAILDRESTTRSHVYELDVYVVDVQSTSPKTTKCKVTISLLDKNDSPPVFPRGLYKFSLSEDAPPGDTVATISAVDPDVEGSVTYALVDNGNKFKLDGKSGLLTLKEPLDREVKQEHRLVVRADDGVQTSEVSVLIQVIDANDNPPAFQEYAYSFDVPEDVLRGAQVGTVKATDLDEGINGEVSYLVLSDWGNDLFSLNPQTGVFTLTSHLDYEQVQHYIFIVQAEDSGQPKLSSTVTVYFNVLDLNDNSPLFDPMSYSDEVFENITIGTSVVQVSATDLDSGENGQVTYSIVEGNDGGHFTISSNGTIYTTKMVDREVQSFYNLVVSATDLASPPEKRLSSTVQVTIILKDVNDMSPEFVTPTKTSISENVPINTIIMPVKAVDRDEGHNSYIEYSLLHQSDSKFSIGPIDGLLRVNGPVDRESKSSYSVVVVAKDRGYPSRSSSVEILVNIMDENDNNPVFDPKQYSGSVSENASIGLSILQVSATDQDEGLSGQVRYSIISGDSNHDFVIGEDTGVIRISKNLDYERKNRYVLTIQAEDSGNEVRHDTAIVAITVKDINDNAPTFLDSPYEVHVMENTAMLPISIITVKAYDADLLPNNNIHYLIKDGEKQLFRINSSSGEIQLHRTLDREEHPKYVLTIVAMDSGIPRQTGTGTVIVVLSDVNDNAPAFDRNHYTAKITENSPANTEVMAITANDADDGRNSLLRYSLEGKHFEQFRVDPLTGSVTTQTVLDREEQEEYSFLLVVRDSGLIVQHTANATITIVVEDENDNTPQFTEKNYNVYVPDDASGGHFVLGTQANDPDMGLNSHLVYHLSGTDADKFQINQDTGIIKLVEKLSEKKDGYQLEIFASDSGSNPLSTSAAVQVFLMPARFFPAFKPSIRSFNFPESARNVFVTTLTATSPKKGALGIIHYSIAGGNIWKPFSINGQSGELQIIGGLDHETVSLYELWIEARDSDSPSLSSTGRLDIVVSDSNDNMPIFEQEYYNASIREEQQPPQFVLTVKATDLDSADNGLVTYQLLSDSSLPFVLDSATGKIHTTVMLDREQVEFYQLVVAAVDQGSPQKTGTATIYITVLDKNDNPPRFTRLFSVNVTENAPLGTFVIQVTSSDKDIDANGKATYSFTENPSGKFHIDPVSGNVTVSGWIDREIKDEYLLKVAAVDGSWRAETPLTIYVQDINDNAPKFSTSVYAFNVPELQQAVSFVGQVSAVDQDKHGPNSVITYSLKRPSDFFRIDPASGQVLTKQVLQYKRSSHGVSPENQHTLHLIATDHGKPPLSSEAVVQINIVDSNNNAPEFELVKYIRPVPMDVPVGLVVLQIKASYEGDVGVNAEIEYNIKGGNGTDLFEINSATGWIIVKEFLERLEGQWFVLQVTAADKGIPPKYAETNVTLIVTEENEHSPVFAALSYQVTISESEALHSEIAIISATDADRGLNGQIEYSVMAGNKNGTFSVGTTSGIVTLVKLLDFEMMKEYHLNITATDKGFTSKHTTATLTVIVSDVNDNPPIFNSTDFYAYIEENRPSGSYVSQITATDADSKKNGVIQYSLVSHQDSEVFQINPITGVLTSKVVFNYEERNSYSIQLVASNPGTSQFSSVKVQVHITGINEFYPKFVQQLFQFTVSESSVVGTTVGSLQATDGDGGPDGEVFYYLVGSSNKRGFRVNSKTGLITVARNLDRESQARVVLTVMAKNRGSIHGNDTDEAQVIISIQDGNDPPIFSKDFYEAHVSESASPGTSFITVSAVDKDVRPSNNQFTYSMIDTNSKAFTIDPNSGSIQTAMTLDRETTPFYNLTVAAIDSGIPPQTGTAIVRVIVDDVNDNGPVFGKPDVVGYVTENAPPLTSVMVLTATDPDLPPNGAPFTYFLVGGEHKNFFELDRHTGLIHITKSINREQLPSIVLMVEVHDSGSPPRKSRHPITIVVMDENDSPSSPRMLTILVWVYNNMFRGGKLGDVQPLDPDLVGDYRCSLIEEEKGSFHIPGKCELHASRMHNPHNHSLLVSGNDGRHSNVTSTVHVKFLSFDNATTTSSVTLRLLNRTAEAFLGSEYSHFMKVLTQIFKTTGVPVLYSITNSAEHVEMTLAIKTAKDTYIHHDKVVMQLRENYERLLQNLVIGYNPCTSIPCQHGGTCRSFFDFKDTLSIIDSPSLTFTSPTVSRQYQCECLQGYSGNVCQYQQDPCAPNPCINGGICRHNGLVFECICDSHHEGKRCEIRRKDLCASFPCKNGGSCETVPDGSFFCLCRPGYRGNVCEQASDSCRPNRCMNGGTCVNKKPGYECLCDSNFYGRHCEKSTFGFELYSYMAFSTLDSSTNDLAITFSTNQHNALLFYSFGSHSGGRSDFIALELVDGKAQFSFGGSRTAIASIVSDNLVADGKWHKITVVRNGRVASLSIANCQEFGEICEDCSHDNVTCFYSTAGHTGSLNFNENPLYVGGIPSVDLLLDRPGQVHSDDFVGCIHSASVNGRLLNLKSPLKSHNISPTCGRKTEVCSGSSQCGESGKCQDLWYTFSCTCSAGISSPNCNDALEPLSLGAMAGYMELIPQEKFRRLFSQSSVTRWKRSISRPKNVLSFQFRTTSPDSILMTTITDDQQTMLSLKGGHLHYTNQKKPFAIETGGSVSDGQWHRVDIHQSTNISVDGRLTQIEGIEFLTPYLTSLVFGDHRDKDQSPVENMPDFRGCLQMITLNGEVQAQNWSHGYFQFLSYGAVQRGCSNDVLGLDAIHTDPLSIGVVLVIVFFVILLVVILVSFVVFRKRKLRRDKYPSHTKQNGATFLTSPSDSQRPLQDSVYVDGSSPDDILRNHMPQDLVPKKFKDRDIERPQRPDIIEREVINKSPLNSIPRMEEPPGIPEPVKSHFNIHGLDSEPPEHYDLENASSIAPSDIDIVYHYKGFRDGNLRKYKANLPSYHKHNHRHSPHSFQASPVRENILRQSPSSVVPRDSPSALKMQNTPLARLSPSSELSQQTPRILTLQDISGKPLQTALLATTQGVGPKELRDSPVSHLSHSSGSMQSGPVQSIVKNKGEPTLGLTAEEIERLNSRPRNSSLVSTLDAVSSSSSDNNTDKNKLAELLETNTQLLEAQDSSTDESGNDSFTCSEFEYDNNYDKVHRDFGPGNMIFSKLAEEDNEDESSKTYDGFDSFRGSLSTLVASDDDISNLSSYKPPNGSLLGWDYLLNWGPNFQNFVGVFKDIAELPDTVMASGAKASEEYV